jgi:hypothetical protein
MGQSNGRKSDRLITALTENQARYYKLTPPFSVEHMRSGHGFHFILPGGMDGEIFLDVMGKPPRTNRFAETLATARKMQTEWGLVHTIGIMPLVEVKKTQRLGDYPIISKLALAWFDQPECKKTAADFLWALQNIFTLPELALFFSEYPEAVRIAEQQFNSDVGLYGRQILAGGEISESVERVVGELFQARIAELQASDRHYWRDIIRKLKELRAAGKLAPEGKKVS